MNKPTPSMIQQALSAVASYRRKQMRAQRVMSVELSRIINEARKNPTKYQGA